MRQKHKALFEHFSGIFAENNQEEQYLSSKDYTETSLMLQYKNKD